MPATPRKSRSFGGSAAHQKAMMANLCASLFAAEAIVTTEAKAKALRPVAEKLITKARKGSVHDHRLVVRFLRDREMTTKLVMSWSGGKDSACALWRLQQDPRYDVCGLLTTVTEDYERISMHGVRAVLLRAQAAELGLPLHEVRIPPGCSNADYEARMGEAVRRLMAEGVEAAGFGDLFLEDIRAYRERQFAALGDHGPQPGGGDGARGRRAHVRPA